MKATTQLDSKTAEGKRGGIALQINEAEAELGMTIGQGNATSEEAEQVAERLTKVEGELARAIKQTNALGEEHEQVAARLAKTEAELGAAIGQANALSEEREHVARRLGEVEAELVSARAEHDVASTKVAELSDALHTNQVSAEQLDRLIVAESTLRQREEEVAQTGAELAEVRTRSAALDTQLHKLEAASERQRQELMQRIAAQKEALKTSAKTQTATDAALRGAESRLDDHVGELVDLTLMVLEADTVIAQTKAELHLARKQASDEAQLRTELQSAAKAALARSESRHMEHAAETARLKQIAANREASLAAEAAKLEWLQKVAIARLDLPWWWMLMPHRWRVRQEHERLLRQELFDAAAYLKDNPDVATTGVDPLRHYILHGLTERNGES